MKISGIVSVGPNFEIGHNGQLYSPNTVDMAFFCGFTQGKLVVMGRKTVESLKNALPGREVVCVSRCNERALRASQVVSAVWNGGDLDVLKKLAAGRDIVIAGGAEVYSMFSGCYDELYVTYEEQEPDGSVRRDADAFFPEYLISQCPHATRIFKSARFNVDVYRYSKEPNDV